MGKQSPSGQEVAQTVVSGTFTGTGQSGNATSGVQTTGGTQPKPPVFQADFNIALWGTFVATIQLEKSYDGGTTWLPIAKNVNGDLMSYTIPINMCMWEPEHNILYRWNCTAYTSGTVNYRISK